MIEILSYVFAHIMTFLAMAVGVVMGVVFLSVGIDEDEETSGLLGAGLIIASIVLAIVWLAHGPFSCHWVLGPVLALAAAALAFGIIDDQESGTAAGIFAAVIAVIVYAVIFRVYVWAHVWTFLAMIAGVVMGGICLAAGLDEDEGTSGLLGAGLIIASIVLAIVWLAHGPFSSLFVLGPVLLMSLLALAAGLAWDEDSGVGAGIIFSVLALLILAIIFRKGLPAHSLPVGLTALGVIAGVIIFAIAMDEKQTSSLLLGISMLLGSLMLGICWIRSGPFSYHWILAPLLAMGTAAILAGFALEDEKMAGIFGLILAVVALALYCAAFWSIFSANREAVILMTAGVIIGALVFITGTSEKETITGILGMAFLLASVMLGVLWISLGPLPFHLVALPFVGMGVAATIPGLSIDGKEEAAFWGLLVTIMGVALYGIFYRHYVLENLGAFASMLAGVVLGVTLFFKGAFEKNESVSFVAGFLVFVVSIALAVSWLKWGPFSMYVIMAPFLLIAAPMILIGTKASSPTATVGGIMVAIAAALVSFISMNHESSFYSGASVALGGYTLAVGAGSFMYRRGIPADNLESHPPKPQPLASPTGMTIHAPAQTGIIHGGMLELVIEAGEAEAVCFCAGDHHGVISVSPGKKFKLEGIPLHYGKTTVSLGSRKSRRQGCKSCELEISACHLPFVGLIDPWTRETMKPGDEVVRCKKDRVYSLKASWEDSTTGRCGECGHREFFTPDDEGFYTHPRTSRPSLWMIRKIISLG